MSFPLEDKNVVNEHHVARKNHDTTQKKNVLTWYISKYHMIGLQQTHAIKNATPKTAKKFVGVAVYWKERYLTDKSDTWIGVGKTNQFIYEWTRGSIFS